MIDKTNRSRPDRIKPRLTKSQPLTILLLAHLKDFLKFNGPKPNRYGLRNRVLSLVILVSVPIALSGCRFPIETKASATETAAIVIPDPATTETPPPEIVTPPPEIVTPPPEIVTPPPEIVTPPPEIVIPPTIPVSLSISGSPITSVTDGEFFSFSPETSYTGDNALTYSVANLPPWANFDSGSGSIWGTPDSNSTGIFSGITVTVSDGALSSSISPFSLEVNFHLRNVRISWLPNTEYDLAGYVIYYGQYHDSLTHFVRADSESFAHILEIADAGDYYFGVASIDASGNESELSDIVHAVL